MTENVLLQEIIWSIFSVFPCYNKYSTFDYEMRDSIFNNSRPKKIELFSEHFLLAGIPEKLKIRFIQLLQSYALRLFSFTSKQNYYDCLNLRGIECDEVKVGAWSFSSFNITNRGRLQIDYEDICSKYIRPVHLVEINDDYDDWFNVDLKPIYPLIDFNFSNFSSLEHISKFYHSKLRNVEMELKFEVNNQVLVNLLTMFNSVENITIQFELPENSKPKMNPKALKELLENWIKQKPVPLRRFYIYYHFLIIYHKGKLLLAKKHPAGQVFFNDNFPEMYDQRIFDCFPFSREYSLFEHQKIL